MKFVYSDDLGLKNDNDFDLIRELFRLCDRYDFSRLFVRLTDKLYEKSQTLLKSREDFKNLWPKMHSILMIAFEYKIEKLIDKVMTFIDEKFDHFMEEDNEVLLQLNDLTDGRLLILMIYQCPKNAYSVSERVKLRKFKDLLILVTKKCKQLTEVNERLKDVKGFNCDKCGPLNHAQSIDTSSN